MISSGRSVSVFCSREREKGKRQIDSCMGSEGNIGTYSFHLELLRGISGFQEQFWCCLVGWRLLLQRRSCRSLHGKVRYCSCGKLQ
jgi:hypothetical protein